MQPGDLPRKLGLLDASALVVGIVIGSAVYIVPRTVAQLLPSAGWILAAWIVAGALSLLGALAFAELGAMLPDTGGQYVYLREAYGPLWGFLWGWALLLAIRSGGSAALSVGFSLYLGHFVPLSPLQAKLVSVAIVGLFTWVNYRGVRVGAAVNNVFTFLKVAGLVSLIGLAFGSGQPRALEWSAPGNFSWSSFGVAMIACFWANQGWFSMSIVAGEIRNPQRNIPLALGGGVAVATTLYVLANLAYLWVLPISQIAASPRVAATMTERVVGPGGAALVSLIILISIAGALHGGILTGPRAYFAQARDGLFFKVFSRVHPRHQTPAPAILLQGAWAVVLAASGTYQNLFQYVIFVSWIFYGLTVLAVPILRRRHPEWARPYKMWGYPVTPVIFLAATAVFLVNAAITKPGPSLFGTAVLAAAIPLYYLWRGSRRAAAPAATAAAVPHTD